MNLRAQRPKIGFYTNMDSSENLSGQRAQLLNNIKFEITRKLNGKKTIGRIRLDITASQLSFLKEFNITKRFQCLNDFVVHHLDIDNFINFSRNGNRTFVSDIRFKIGNLKKSSLTNELGNVNTFVRGPELVIHFSIRTQHVINTRILGLMETINNL